MRIKLIRWAIFSALISLLPLWFNYLVMRINGFSPPLKDLISHGELLLITAGLSAAAVGKVIASGRNYANRKFLAAGGCLIVLLTSSFYFAYISSLYKSAEILDINFIAHISLVLYFSAIFSSAACVRLSEA